MLEAIRKHAGSLVVKILFGVLVLSFVVWGVADVFRPRGGTDWAAKVGGTTIPTTAFEDEYRQTVRRVGRAMGKPLDPQQARALGLPESVMRQMVEGALLDLAAADMGLRVGDDTIREAIRSNPQFRNSSGVFDEQVFRSLLANNGFTEERYVGLLRRELLREQLVGTVAAGVAVPAAMAEAVGNWRGERRVADWVTFRAGDEPVPADPGDEVLRKFHEDYPGLFTAPEYRSLSVVVLTPDTVAKDITLDDAALRKSYEERLGEFQQPERRSFRQLVFADQAAADRARATLATGGSFDAVAAEAGQTGAGSATIGPVTRSQLPAELATAVFAHGKGEVGEPVHSPLGWHVVEVVGIEPESTKSFDAVKDQIADDLRHEKAVDELVSLGNKLEDILGRGATLVEAASELSLPVRTIPAIDAQGRDVTGAEVADVPAGVADTAFETAPQTESGLVEIDRDGWFVLRVDSVTPSAVKPFETVRAEVLEAWRDRQRNDAAKARAEALADRARTRGSLAAAREGGPASLSTPPFTRTGEGAPDGFPHPLQTALFAAKAGDVVVVPLEDGWAVARLSSIVPPPSDALASGEAAVRGELTEELGGDLLAQYSAALRARWTVEVNPRALERIS